jgi:hypothetical protein
VFTPLLQVGGVLAVLAALLAALLAWIRSTARTARHPEPQRRPLQVVAADVRRLGRQIPLVPPGAPVPRALVVAYEEVLIEAAVLLDVPNDLRTAPAGPVRDAARLRLLAELEEAGLAVHA